MPTQGHDLCSALGRGLPWRRGCQRPTVDQTAQGQREGQRRQCREQKKQPGKNGSSPDKDFTGILAASGARDGAAALERDADMTASVEAGGPVLPEG
jgi:hypothetical protein